MRTLLFLLFVTTSILGRTQTFTLTSSDVGGQATAQQVFNGMGCTGQNQSPQLSWTHAPAGTKSFAVTMYDPDAPTGSGFWHWVVFDLPANTTNLPTGAGSAKGTLPAGTIQGITDFGAPGYGGPCPPPGHGAHRYVITVFALKTDKLGLDEKASPAYVGFNLHAQTLAKASILFYYER